MITSVEQDALKLQHGDWQMIFFSAHYPNQENKNKKKKTCKHKVARGVEAESYRSHHLLPGFLFSFPNRGLLSWLNGKEPTCQGKRLKRPEFNSLVRKEIAAYTSILAWKTPWTEEPGGLPSKGLQRVKHDRAAEHTCISPASHGQTPVCSAPASTSSNTETQVLRCPDLHIQYGPNKLRSFMISCPLPRRQSKSSVLHIGVQNFFFLIHKIHRIYCFPLEACISGNNTSSLCNKLFVEYSRLLCYVLGTQEAKQNPCSQKQSLMEE